jgi:hypothetical protein
MFMIDKPRVLYQIIPNSPSLEKGRIVWTSQDGCTVAIQHPKKTNCFYLVNKRGED